MPVYVYGCGNRDHETKDVRHEVGKEVVILCPTCGGQMHRIPQGFQIRVPPSDAGQRNAKDINNYLESKYKNNKARREAQEYSYRIAQESKGVKENG